MTRAIVFFVFVKHSRPYILADSGRLRNMIALFRVIVNSIVYKWHSMDFTGVCRRSIL